MYDCVSLCVTVYHCVSLCGRNTKVLSAEAACCVISANNENLSSLGTVIKGNSVTITWVKLRARLADASDGRPSTEMEDKNDIYDGGTECEGGLKTVHPSRT